MNNISISLRTNTILITINDEAEQLLVINELEKKLEEIKSLYQGTNSKIIIYSKLLSDEEKEQIENTIKSVIDIEIEYANENQKDLGLHTIKKPYNKDTKESMTKYIRVSLRSGQVIEYDGSIVIMGDVNDGAQVIASDNIVIVGILRGLAHAGAKGNNDAIIAAEAIESAQLRISNVVKEIDRFNKSEDETIKTYAYLDQEKGQIVIE